jgi:ubiquinone biosynthesis protein UbiJ
MYEGLEELRKEVARLNARVEVMESKVAKCFETVARLMEELERLKRRVRRPSLRGCMEALKAYNEVEADEPGSP